MDLFSSILIYYKKISTKTASFTRKNTDKLSCILNEPFIKNPLVRSCVYFLIAASIAPHAFQIAEQKALEKQKNILIQPQQVLKLLKLFSFQPIRSGKFFQDAYRKLFIHSPSSKGFYISEQKNWVAIFFHENPEPWISCQKCTITVNKWIYLGDSYESLFSLLNMLETPYRHSLKDPRALDF